MTTSSGNLLIPPQLVNAIPHFTEYFGLWVIEPNAMLGLFEIASKLDIAAHLNSERPLEVKAAASSGKGSYYRQDVEGVAHISLSGPLQKHASSFSGGTSTVLARQDVRSAARDPDVGSILLRIESPGGTFAGNSELAEEIERASEKKPVYAYINDLGASAAYWLASSAQHVMANKEALVGSIGTYASVTDYSGRAASEGVKVHVIRAGAFKGMGTPGTEITPEQLAEMQRHVDSRNQFFLEAVAKGRKVSMDYVKSQLADGRLHTASEAIGLKLIDSIASLEEAHEKAKAAVPKRAKGSLKMSDTQNPADAVVTPQQIRAACPGASTDFIVDCLDRKLTIEAASGLWTSRLNDRVGELTKANSEFEAKIGELTKQNAELVAANAKLTEDLKAKENAPLAKTGVPGLPVSTKTTAATPADAYWSKVSEVQKEDKLTKAQAMSHVNKNYPELVQAMHGATA
jgi:signal peptide peptidase SppA